MALRKALGQVEAETINLILLKQELQIPFDILLHQLTLMIEIMEHAVRVRSIHIEVGIIACRLILVGVPIEFGKGMIARSVIVHHVENYRHIQFVAPVDELSIHR